MTYIFTNIKISYYLVKLVLFDLGYTLVERTSSDNKLTEVELKVIKYRNSGDNTNYEKIVMVLQHIYRLNGLNLSDSEKLNRKSLQILENVKIRNLLN